MAKQELHTFYIVQYVALSRKGQSAISQLIILEFFCQGSRKNKKIELLYQKVESYPYYDKNLGMLLEKETGNSVPRIQGSTKTFLILPCPILIVTDNKVNVRLSKSQTLVLTYGSINQANISSVHVMSKCEENIE